MSEVVPVSTSALYTQRIARLEAAVANLRRQVTEQGVYIVNQDRLRATQPLRNNGKRYPARLGSV